MNDIQIPRKTVSEDFLLKHLNDHLQQQPGCEGCFFLGVTPLAETDADGCNWSASNVRVSGAHPADYDPAAREIIQAARMKFNLQHVPEEIGVKVRIRSARQQFIKSNHGIDADAVGEVTALDRTMGPGPRIAVKFGEKQLPLILADYFEPV